tara:strand:- start:156 stop:911 length:756 start_codon:yes stop_codon:yes gene_type:complete
MMLESIILILTEIMEASVLIALLYSGWNCIGLNGRSTTLKSIIIGMICSLVIAYYLGDISDTFEGRGQELLNAILLSFCIGLIFIYSYFCLNEKTNVSISFLTGSLIVIFSITREVSEIAIFLMGYIYNSELLPSLLFGGLIGIGIGTSFGILLYYFLGYISSKKSKIITVSLLGLLAAGMSTELISYLMQVDIIGSTTFLYDSSFIINESSLIGRFSYAIFRYESTPTLLQFLFYVFILCSFSTLIIKKG